MRIFKYQYCKARMIAFLHGELPPGSRRRVAQYIDEYPRCYAEYVRQRSLQHELGHRLPSLGQPTPDQLERIWAGIQEEMRPAPRRKSQPAFVARYGLATLALVMVLLIPLLLGSVDGPPITVTQPRPADLATEATASPPNPTSIAAAPTQPAVITAPVHNSDDPPAPEAAPQRTPVSEK
jgi:anti-sigma factor RsiW